MNQQQVADDLIEMLAYGLRCAPRLTNNKWVNKKIHQVTRNRWIEQNLSDSLDNLISPRIRPGVRPVDRM